MDARAPSPIASLDTVRLPDKAALLARVRDHRGGWAAARRPTTIEPVGEGEESVWDFPRPPRVETVTAPVTVTFQGTTIASTTAALRVLETAGAPVYHVPFADIIPGVLFANGRVTLCEWKGAAVYCDLHVAGAVSRDAAYTYPDPIDDLGQGYSRLRDTVVFYADRVDAATIAGETVRPQPGGYYSGWVRSNLKGPIKGAPGSEHW